MAQISAAGASLSADMPGPAVAGPRGGNHLCRTSEAALRDDGDPTCSPASRLALNRSVLDGLQPWCPFHRSVRSSSG